MNERVKESPDYLRTSTAAAMVLGYKGGLFFRNARVPCINLLLTYPEGCMANCAYCGLSRHRKGEYVDKSFIRVEWPTYPTGDIAERIAARPRSVRRACISMITNRRALDDVVKVTERIKARADVPISVLIAPTLVEREHLEAFQRAGADRIGVAIDVANPGLFDKLRGRQARGPHEWDTYWRVLHVAMEVFTPPQVGVHMMVGMGETEEEMMGIIQRIHDEGSSATLFSFYPEGDSRMARHPIPPMGQYRRIQLGRYLVNRGFTEFSRIHFDAEGRIKDFGVSPETLEEAIQSGIPFETTGCPDRQGNVACNRPFANSLPGPDIRNYPFPLEPEDVERVRSQLWTTERLAQAEAERA